jgi:uncharacterized protein YqfA (UPF0365 family)
VCEEGAGGLIFLSFVSIYFLIVIFKFVPVELMVGLYIFELAGPVGF